MPLAPNHFESAPVQPRRITPRSIGQRLLLLAGLVVGSAYAVGDKATGLVKDATQEYLNHEYGDDGNNN